MFIKMKSVLNTMLSTGCTAMLPSENGPHASDGPNLSKKTEKSEINPSTTLYGILKPLISGAKTGVITVVSEYGPQGKIYLKNGRLVGAETENLTGASAANVLAKWVSISTEFTAGIEEDIENPDVLDHMGIVKLLAERHRTINEIRKIIPGNDAIYKFLVDSWQEKTVSVQQLELITKLDGHHSLRQVVGESGVAELEVLKFIYYLNKKGLVKELASTQAMKKEDIDNFLAALRSKLADLVGPAAESVIQKVFESLGIDPNFLVRSQIAEVFESVLENLDEMESEVFYHWKNRYFKKLNKKG